MIITPAHAQSIGGGPAGTGAMPLTFADMWPSLLLVAVAVVVALLATRSHSR